MKKRIIEWALRKLLAIVNQGNSEEMLQGIIRSLIFKLYSNTLLHKLLDREISSMIFDAKYTDNLISLNIKDTTPSKILTSYYALANKGIEDFKREDFYRVLAKNKDIEVHKLNYRIKRAN